MAKLCLVGLELIPCRCSISVDKWLTRTIHSKYMYITSSILFYIEPASQCATEYLQ